MRLPITAALTLMATACSHGVREPRETTPSHDSEVIMAQELSTTQGSTVYDAVRQLRPAWILRSRPTAVMQRNQAQLIVYVDGVRYAAGIESLRLFPINSAASVRYYSPGNAEAHFGPGHLLGAIEVLTAPH